MSFELPPLPWAKDALAPHISEETIDYHYGKHHAGYVNKLNAQVAGTDQASQSLDDLLMSAEGGVYNNVAQIINHTLYWHSMSPNGGGEPTGAIADKINEDFGSFDDFKTQFSAVGGGHFGSGWAFLVQRDDGHLGIEACHDAGNPHRDDTGKILLALDVWEHAYYIDYRNGRGNYIAAWWNLINWDYANANLA